MSAAADSPLGWGGVARLGLVQTALGSVVVLTSASLNRVIVVEHAMPAVLPGALMALYYAVQLIRPRLGHGSDQGGRCTPWIIGGMAVLAAGGLLASVATALMGSSALQGVALAVVAFVLVGLGVGAAGTSLLVLLAARVPSHRKPGAASLVWIMMIAGFVLTTAVAGQFLDPYSPERLVTVTFVVGATSFLLSVVAVAGIETSPARRADAPRESARFRIALREVWAEPSARQFTCFVFVSMLAYSAQDLVLEPFAGTVFGLSLGETTRLSSVQHGGVLAGMIGVAILGGVAGGGLRTLRICIQSGCLGALVVLLALAFASTRGDDFPLHAAFFGLGVANGTFAAAAIAAMMQLVGAGTAGRAGVRMGLFGAAQAVAFGLGGFLGTLALDIGRYASGSAATGYAAVFLVNAGLFLVATLMAAHIGRSARLRDSFSEIAPAASAG